MSWEDSKITVHDKNFEFDSFNLAHSQCLLAVEITAIFIGVEYFEWTLELPRLQVLDLSHNQIESFYLRSSIKLGCLKVVNLADNLLKLIANVMFPSCPKLKIFHIFKNPLVTFNFKNASNLPELSEIVFGDTNMQQLEEISFLGVKNLRLLEIKDTKLEYITTILNITHHGQEMEFRAINNSFSDIRIVNRGRLVNLKYSNYAGSENTIEVEGFKELNTCIIQYRISDIISSDLKILKICDEEEERIAHEMNIFTLEKVQITDLPTTRSTTLIIQTESTIRTDFTNTSDSIATAISPPTATVTFILAIVGGVALILVILGLIIGAAYIFYSRLTSHPELGQSVDYYCYYSDERCEVLKLNEPIGAVVGQNFVDQCNSVEQNDEKRYSVPL